MSLAENEINIEKNKKGVHDNAIGWKIATCISCIALVYSILSNYQQDKSYVTIEEAQCMVYQHLTGMKDPIHECP